MNLKNKNNTVKVKASTGKKVGNRTVIGIVCILVAFAVCFGIIRRACGDCSYKADSGQGQYDR